MDRVTLRQSYEFSAAHRLHVPSLSDAENRQLFGKCNNPAGHGHNYRVEPVVAVKVGAEGARFSLADLERLTEEHIVARFDHKHLNQDTREFGPGPGGVNPSVENIARVFFEALAGPVRAAGADATLRSVTVWETDRTCATYAGE